MFNINFHGHRRSRFSPEPAGDRPIRRQQEHLAAERGRHEIAAAPRAEREAGRQRRPPNAAMAMTFPKVVLLR